MRNYITKISGLKNFRVRTASLALICLFTLFNLFPPAHAQHKTGSGELSILCMGDILLARDGVELIELNGKDYPFKKIEYEFNNYSIVFANLEVPITYRGIVHPTKPYTFRLHPDNASHLRSMKLNVLSVANNHILDYGRDGMFDTLTFISGWGIKYSGAGKDLKEARTPAIINSNGTNVLFLSYCERPPADFYATESTPGTSPLKLSSIIEDIEKYKTGENLVFISLHWGIEHNDFPEKYQINLAHSIIDAGADGIIGHHPHVPQGIEIYNNKPILYSLGNAIVGFYNPNYTNNIMTSLHYRNNKIQNIKIIPMAGKHKDIKSQPYLLNGQEAIDVINHLKRISKPFKTDIEYSDGIGKITVQNGN